MEKGRINWDKGSNVPSIVFIGIYFESVIVCRVIRGNIGVSITLLMLDGTTFHSISITKSQSYGILV